SPCLGLCDRAPAAMLTVAGAEGRSFAVAPVDAAGITARLEATDPGPIGPPPATPPRALPTPAVPTPAVPPAPRPTPARAGGNHPREMVAGTTSARPASGGTTRLLARVGV